MKKCKVTAWGNRRIKTTDVLAENTEPQKNRCGIFDGLLRDNFYYSQIVSLNFDYMCLFYSIFKLVICIVRNNMCIYYCLFLNYFIL